MIKIKFEPPIIQAIPLSPDDLIQVELVSTIFPIPIEIEGTCYNQDGDIVQFREVVNILSANNYSVTHLRLGYFFLLSIVAQCRTVSIPDGSTYCRLTLVKSPNAGVYPHRKLLSQGYISTIGSIGYGSDSISGPPSDHYFVENIALTDPGANNPMDYLVPNFTEIILQSVRCSFTSSAAVANRFIQLHIILPSGATHTFTQATAQTASFSSVFLFAPDLSELAFGIISIAKSSIPLLTLTNGVTIRLTSVTFGAGDAFTNGAILIKRRTVPF